MIILSTLKVVSSITVFLFLVLTLITILLFVKSKLSPESNHGNAAGRALALSPTLVCVSDRCVQLRSVGGDRG